MLRVISAVVGVCILGLILAQTNTQQPCWNHFGQVFTQCVQNVSINTQQLLYLTSNGSEGTAPPNLAVLKNQSCDHQTNIFNCTLRVRNALLNNSACPNSEKSTINNFFGRVFGPYDIICAHPCRFTMIENLRSCYSKSKLNPELFMPNNTKSMKSMLGDTEKAVDTFCIAKDQLVDCMKSEAMKCPESAVVMNNIRLDLVSMETSVDVLCLHPKVYLDSLKCFSSPSEEVSRCGAQQNKDVYDLGMEAQNTKMEETEFLKRFCELRFKYLACDLSAWRNNTSDQCNPSIVGMKTELDCKLIPEECKATLGKKYDTVCSKVHFKTDIRDNYGKASATSVCPSLLPGILILMYYFLYN